MQLLPLRRCFHQMASNNSAREQAWRSVHGKPGLSAHANTSNMKNMPSVCNNKHKGTGTHMFWPHVSTRGKSARGIASAHVGEREACSAHKPLIALRVASGIRATCSSACEQAISVAIEPRASEIDNTHSTAKARLQSTAKPKQTQ